MSECKECGAVNGQPCDIGCQGGISNEEMIMLKCDEDYREEFFGEEADRAVGNWPWKTRPIINGNVE